jgi:aspartate racemase
MSAKRLHIGLIGGIGVASTVSYYQRLTAAVAKYGGTADITIVHADVRELIRNTSADKRAVQAQIYAKLIDRLKAAGADCAAITSLGGHFCFAETQAISALPLLSGVSPLDDYFADQGIKKVGLLGTRIVMDTLLFGQLNKTQAIVLEDEIDTLGQTYLDMAVAMQCSPDQQELFHDAGRRMVNDHGVDAIVLAGTDLSLAFENSTVEYPVIDALDVHVDVLARLATGQMNLDVKGIVA